MLPPDNGHHESRPFYWIGNELPGVKALGEDQSATLLYLWPILVAKPDIEFLSEHFAGKIRALQPLGPYLLGGHCFSSLLAYEVARRLIASGQEVQLLVMLDPWMPGWSSRPLQIIQRLLLSVLHPSTLVPFINRRLGRSAQGPRQLPLNEFEQSKQREQSAMWFKMTAKAVDGYRLRPYPGRLTLFVGDRMKEKYFLRRAWAPFARGGVEVHLVPAVDWEELYWSETTAIQIRKSIDQVSSGRVPVES